MPQIPPLVDNKVLRPAQTALALELLTRMDLLRLKTIARLYARGAAVARGDTYHIDARLHAAAVILDATDQRVGQRTAAAGEAPG